MHRWELALQAFCEFGPKPLFLNAIYHLGLRSGVFSQIPRVLKADELLASEIYQLKDIFTLPGPLELEAVMGKSGLANLICTADEIVAGHVRLFGGQPQPLNLVPAGELQHWTAYELGKARVQVPHGDIKFIWEPCRFGWAFILGRAYHVTQDESYAAAFWTSFETFNRHNPPFQGPNWASAQEVALRLIALVFAGQVFAASEHSTSHRRLQLGQAIAYHAQRIPPTLMYARAQNNNHLLSEATGLFTAALALPLHPLAPRWQKLGWNWFQTGIHKQVTPDGVYIQHSTNYHRLMLQLALWMDMLCRQQDLALSETSRERLAAATRWLLVLSDPVSGRVPNLGANDGAYILPLSLQPFEDYRPVMQAAGMAFLHKQPLQAGAWDEMSLWFGLDSSIGEEKRVVEPALELAALERKIGVVRHPQKATSWAYLRLADFQDRPSHADLLHVDLWHEGMNLALDAGTYLYNASPPWDNALTRTQVHNTVLVDEQEQMRRVGRFLYLEWAHTQVVSCEQRRDGSLKKLVAQHNGYARLGVIHQRTLSAQDDSTWLVEDHIFELKAAQKQTANPHVLCLQWLLPDHPWFLENRENGLDINLDTHTGRIKLSLNVKADTLSAVPLQVKVIRAGELLEGDGNVSPTWGWSSPCYGEKIPALAIHCRLESQLPVLLTSRWIFYEG